MVIINEERIKKLEKVLDKYIDMKSFITLLLTLDTKTLGENTGDT